MDTYHQSQFLHLPTAGNVTDMLVNIFLEQGVLGAMLDCSGNLLLQDGGAGTAGPIKAPGKV